MQDVVTKKYLRFEVKHRDPLSKTIQIGVTNIASPVYIGYITWFGPWRKYTFNPLNMTIYDAGCLRDIADYLDEVNQDHKNSKQPKLVKKSDGRTD